MYSWSVVRECAGAMLGHCPLDVVVAADPGPIDFSDRVAFDPLRYPTLKVPAACVDAVTKLTAHVASLGGAGVDPTVTGYANGAVVAAYAAACARSALAHRDVSLEVACVTFGMPLCVDAHALGAVNVAHTSDAWCMYPTAPSRRTVWLGAKDSAYYAARVLAYFVEPVPTMTVDEYAEHVQAVPVTDEEWHYVRP
jgi:hypothetical protein